MEYADLLQKSSIEMLVAANTALLEGTIHGLLSEKIIRDKWIRWDEQGTPLTKKECKHCYGTLFSTGDLRTKGAKAFDLANIGIVPEELKVAGFNAKDLMEAKFDIGRILDAGFTVPEVVKGVLELEYVSNLQPLLMHLEEDLAMEEDATKLGRFLKGIIYQVTKDADSKSWHVTWQLARATCNQLKAIGFAAKDAIALKEPIDVKILKALKAAWPDLPLAEARSAVQDITARNLKDAGYKLEDFIENGDIPVEEYYNKASKRYMRRYSTTLFTDEDVNNSGYTFIKPTMTRKGRFVRNNDVVVGK